MFSILGTRKDIRGNLSLFDLVGGHNDRKDVIRRALRFLNKEYSFEWGFRYTCLALVSTVKSYTDAQQVRVITSLHYTPEQHTAATLELGSS